MLFANPRWLVGFTVGLAGWALYVAALRLAPLSLVQAVSAGGIGLLALLVERTTATRLSRREWTGVAAAVAGLVLLGLSLAGGVQTSGDHHAAGAVGLWIVGSLAAAVLLVGPVARASPRRRVSASRPGRCTPPATWPRKPRSWGQRPCCSRQRSSPCHGLAFALLQLGFQRGSALATAGVSTLAMNALPIAAGTLLLGEVIPGGGQGAVRVLAFACVVLGAALLARGDPERGARHVPGTEGQPVSAARAASTSSAVL